MVDQTFFSAASGGPVNADRHDKLPGVPMISKFDDGGAVPQVDTMGNQTGFDTQPQSDGAVPMSNSPAQAAPPDDPNVPAPEHPKRRWGESLGQDLRNVDDLAQAPGRAVAGAVGAVGDKIADVGTAADQGLKNLTPRVMNYLSGRGAMDKQQWDALNEQVGPQMDQSDRTMQVIDAATKQDPQAGAAALQTARQHYDVLKGNATKELHAGNDEVAAQDATMAQNYFPDGNKTVFAPVKGGFAAQVKMPDGNTQTFQLTKEQMHSVLGGEHSLFDHATANGGAAGIISAAAKSGGKPLPNAQGQGAPQQQQQMDQDRHTGYSQSDPYNKTRLMATPGDGTRAFTTGRAPPPGQTAQQYDNAPDTTYRGISNSRPNGKLTYDFSGAGGQNNQGAPQQAQLQRPQQTPSRPANDGSDGSHPASSPNFHRTAQGVTSLETPEEGEEREFVRHRDDLRAAKGQSVDKTVDHSFGGSAPNTSGARGGQGGAQGRGGSEGHATALQNAFGAYRDFLKANPNASQEDKDAALKDNGIDPAKYRQGGYFAQPSAGRQTRSVLDQGTGQNQVHDVPQGHGPNDLIPGRTYKTPKGNMRWDGRQFFPAGQ